MQNVTVERKGDKAILTIDLSKRLGPSKSGNTTLIASSNGVAVLDEDKGIKVSMSVFVKG